MCGAARAPHFFPSPYPLGRGVGLAAPPVCSRSLPPRHARCVELNLLQCGACNSRRDIRCLHMLAGGAAPRRRPSPPPTRASRGIGGGWEGRPRSGPRPEQRKQGRSRFADEGLHSPGHSSREAHPWVAAVHSHCTVRTVLYCTMYIQVHTVGHQRDLRWTDTPNEQVTL